MDLSSYCVDLHDLFQREASPRITGALERAVREGLAEMRFIVGEPATSQRDLRRGALRQLATDLAHAYGHTSIDRRGYVLVRFHLSSTSRHFSTSRSFSALSRILDDPPVVDPSATPLSSRCIVRNLPEIRPPADEPPAATLALVRAFLSSIATLTPAQRSSTAIAAYRVEDPPGRPRSVEVICASDADCFTLVEGYADWVYPAQPKVQVLSAASRPEEELRKRGMLRLRDRALAEGRHARVDKQGRLYVARDRSDTLAKWRPP